LVINGVRVLESEPHTPTQFFWDYPLPLPGGGEEGGLHVDINKSKNKLKQHTAKEMFSFKTLRYLKSSRYLKCFPDN